MKNAAIPTVQYVSPQVWAWRQRRVRSMHESVDLVLCLLPFEKRFYDSHDACLPSSWGTRSPMQLRSTVDRGAARRALGIDPRCSSDRAAAR